VEGSVSSYEELRDVESEMLAGADAFDRDYYQRFGRFPAESQLTEASLAAGRRLSAIRALIEQGATEGERAAASAALGRLEASHRESDSMQRGGNWIDE
jgi:hypothetical protein